MYLQRIPECKTYIKKCVDIDPDFYIAYSKLGGLIIGEGIAKKDKSIFVEGCHYVEKGKKIYDQMGLPTIKEETNYDELFEFALKTRANELKQSQMDNKLYFCEKYENGKTVGVSDKFCITEDGGYLTVMLKLNQPIGLKKVIIDTSINIESQLNSISAMEFTIQPDWIFIHFDKIPFHNTGVHIITVYDEKMNIIASNIVHIQILEETEGK